MEHQNSSLPTKEEFLKAMAAWVAGLALFMSVGYLIRGRLLDPYFSILGALGYIAAVVFLLWICIRGTIALKGTRYRIFYVASASVFGFFLVVILRTLSR